MGYIIELKTSQTSAIKIVIDAINSLLTDINFIFFPIDPNVADSGGIVLKEINKTGKILVHMKLYVDKFDSYKYNYFKEKLTIGLDISNLSKCLKCMTHFDTMSWIVDDDDINKLIVILENIERKEKKTFKINLMDIDEDSYDISPIKYPYVISLPSQDFHKYCKDMFALSDKIEIKATNNKLFFSGKGEICSVEFEVEESTNGLSIKSTIENTNEIVQGLYELKALSLFSRCSQMCPTIELYIRNDSPLVIKYRVADMGSVHLILSPISNGNDINNDDNSDSSESDSDQEV